MGESVRDEMCLTDDLYAGCFTVISPTERNYCCKQTLASHKCICIHLIWWRASRCHLWRRVGGGGWISLTAKVALSVVLGKVEKSQVREERGRARACHLVRGLMAAPWRPQRPWQHSLQWSSRENWGRRRVLWEEFHYNHNYSNHQPASHMLGVQTWFP